MLLLAALFSCAEAPPAQAPGAPPASEASPAGGALPNSASDPGATNPAGPPPGDVQGAPGGSPGGPPPADAAAPPAGAPAPTPEPSSGSATGAATLPPDQQGTVRVSGIDVTKAVAESVGKLMDVAGLKVEYVAADNGGAALKALGAKAADVALIGRPLKPEESSYTATTLGYIGVGLIVNEKNTVANLTKAQVIGLFSGTTTSWKAVGGADTPVSVVVRKEGMTTAKTFEDFFGLGGKILTGANTVTGGEKAVVAAVKASPGGIGFVSIGAVDRTGVKTLSLDGIAPETSAIASHSYPLARPLNAITVGAPTGPAKAFVDFCAGEGGKVVLQTAISGDKAEK